MDDSRPFFIETKTSSGRPSFPDSRLGMIGEVMAAPHGADRDCRLPESSTIAGGRPRHGCYGKPRPGELGKPGESFTENRTISWTRWTTVSAWPCASLTWRSTSRRAVRSWRSAWRRADLTGRSASRRLRRTKRVACVRRNSDGAPRGTPPAEGGEILHHCRRWVVPAGSLTPIPVSPAGRGELGG